MQSSKNCGTSSYLKVDAVGSAGYELAEHKTTMIIVTHEMKFARDAADRILFMDGGVVVEQGDAKELIDHPKEERTRQFLASYGK